jgi:hypothetical protein
MGPVVPSSEASGTTRPCRSLSQSLIAFEPGRTQRIEVSGTMPTSSPAKWFCGATDSNAIAVKPGELLGTTDFGQTHFIAADALGAPLKLGW